MTHDPLCPQDMHPVGTFYCQCDLIRAVREDEQRKYDNEGHDPYQYGYAAALRDAVEAVKTLEPKLRTDKDDGGYDCCGCSTTFDLFDDAVAAIEALGNVTDSVTNGTEAGQ